MAAFGGNQNSAAAPRNLSLSDQLYVPESGASITAYAVCVFSSATDDVIVNLPNAATALDGGRAFAGIHSGGSTATLSGGDSTIKLQKSGVARAYLKTNTACVAGTECGYDPTAAGYVEPVTPVNRGKIVPIGRFSQSKSSSASLQLVGVQLLEPQQASGGALGVTVADGTVLTNTVVETTLGSGSIPAKWVSQAGQTFDVIVRVDVPSGNGADTLAIKAYIGATLIGQTPAIDVTNGGGDVGAINLHCVARVAGAAGKLYSVGYGGLGVPATATQRVTGTVGEASVDWTAAQTIAIKGTWSAADPANQCKLTMLTVKG